MSFSWNKTWRNYKFAWNSCLTVMGFCISLQFPYYFRIGCQWTYNKHKKSVFAVSFLEGPRVAASCDGIVHVSHDSLLFMPYICHTENKCVTDNSISDWLLYWICQVYWLWFFKTKVKISPLYLRFRVPDSRSSYRPSRPDFGKDTQDLLVFLNETTRLVVLHARKTPKMWGRIWHPGGLFRYNLMVTFSAFVFFADLGSICWYECSSIWVPQKHSSDCDDAHASP